MRHWRTITQATLWPFTFLIFQLLGYLYDRNSEAVTHTLQI